MIVKQMLAFVVLIVLLLTVGCGGNGIGGRNSSIVVHLSRTDGTQVLTTYELYITKSGDTTLNKVDPEDYASTLNQPSWSDNYTSSRSSTELQLSFTTRSDQVPYFVWVKVPNTGASFETLNFQIDVDGAVGAKKTYDLNINSTQRLVGVRVNRNAALY
jgi:hypothetical protein